MAVTSHRTTVTVTLEMLEDYLPETLSLYMLETHAIYFNECLGTHNL